ncbi:hypothetical protein SERLA73DRAFT_171168 [Serpula lacrymans var. lacrymans S7.3]|uniref:Methyltransferase domain-containing protein n=2 Tax=Serpula lacrymans var. lacrymans TaxID=341189 RepID=F8QAF4_SERL3|nr:uncharacterized protein SERLADRAFT_452928 [Serpula lacrymans var. lacrymans S7.9]EGN94744.1 hypothetical protein SERLA73DRAFT_171168 [Serpula lacrymans var. lacrymans S7.3]EGO20221.1 hypothetical protein SERLADRAFT_452928 [Serpula lacrymans var. lacrymans S7.9]
MAIDPSRQAAQDSDDEPDNQVFATVTNGNHVDIDDSDAASDTSSVLTEIQPHEFEGYFDERDGRLFHSHGGLPYPLPVDGPEQQRLNFQHDALCQLLNANYVVPLAQILTPTPGMHRRVLDLCTGTGKWVMDMASEFTHVRFHGVDIVPIATREPPANVHFEMADVNRLLRWHDNTMDFVHARSVSLAVVDYPAMLREVARVLRPGGLFFSGEVGRYVKYAPNSRLHTSAYAPGAGNFFRVINDRLARYRQLREITSDIPQWIHESGLFEDITVQEHFIPIGDWHEDPGMQSVGRTYKAAMEIFADSLKPMLRDVGMLEWELEDVVGRFLNDMNTVRGMVSVYHTVWATKV